MRDFRIDLIWTKVQIAVSAIGGWLGYFLGGVDGLMIALIVFMVLDYVTGLMCAVLDKKLSSAVGFRGIFKKALILIMVGIGAVICFYLSNEGLSLLENAAYIGLPVPERLKEVLAQLHNRDKKEKDDTTDDTTNTGDGN